MSTELKKRIITGIILIVAALLVVFYAPPFWFALITALFMLAGAWEWTSLSEYKRTTQCIAYLVLVMASCYAALFIPVIYILLGVFLWWVLALLLVASYPNGSRIWGRGVVLRSVMGIFVLVPCWGAVNFIRNQSDGILILLFLFALIWGADIAAYFAGKRWGKHKLAPEVSPGKSWQGFIAALVFAFVYATGVSLLGGIPRNVLPWGVLLSMVTVVFSVVGDLTESMLKRKAGVKDSGKLLPGHGGILDRIDSLTAAAPVFALGALLIGTYV